MPSFHLTGYAPSHSIELPWLQLFCDSQALETGVLDSSVGKRVSFTVSVRELKQMSSFDKVIWLATVKRFEC